ncbi:hypothetical protein T12_14000 [Trichinella patagoniensis]|uniref:Uncharacterized protein n=1 Tax=Trichinella patagoniensis TaxID=990121 RepID=A0A0V1AF40_9BILA|nr:hypothetical protein T12_14000 [Trichinella patagoniensis]
MSDDLRQISLNSPTDFSLVSAFPHQCPDRHGQSQAGTSADFCMRNLVSTVVSEEYFTFSSFLTIHTVRTHVEQNQLETIGVVEEIRKNMDDFALNVKLLINYAGHLVKSGG